MHSLVPSIRNVDHRRMGFASKGSLRYNLDHFEPHIRQKSTKIKIVVRSQLGTHKTDQIINQLVFWITIIVPLCSLCVFEWLQDESHPRTGGNSSRTQVYLKDFEPHWYTMDEWTRQGSQNQYILHVHDIMLAFYQSIGSNSQQILSVIHIENKTLIIYSQWSRIWMKSSSTKSYLIRRTENMAIFCSIDMYDIETILRTQGIGDTHKRGWTRFRDSIVDYHIRLSNAPL